MNIVKHFGVYGRCIQDNKLLCIQKNGGPYHGLFDLPGGSQKDGESLIATLKREILEETGFYIATIKMNQLFDAFVRIEEEARIVHHRYLFGVTTDYLLKDELEIEVFTDDEVGTYTKTVTFDEAYLYLKWNNKRSLYYASAIFLCITSIIPLLCLTGAAESQLIPSLDFAETVGILLFFIFISSAVALFIYCRTIQQRYDFLLRDTFKLEYGVKGMLKEKQSKAHARYVFLSITGVVLCILSQVPIIHVPDHSFWIGILVSFMLLMIAFGVFLLVIVHIRQSMIIRLIKEGQVSNKKRNARKIIVPLSTVYWLFITALYLMIAWPTQNWGAYWIVWPIASILFVIVLVLSQLIVDRSKQRIDKNIQIFHQNK